MKISQKRLLDLARRKTQFDTLSLPGQPPIMHMGTSNLVHDLWTALREAIGEQDEGHKKDLG